MKTKKEIRNEIYHCVSDMLFELRGEYINEKERSSIKALLMQYEEHIVQEPIKEIKTIKFVKPITKNDNIRVWTPNK